ncbi:hypothetical protein CQA86_28930, partial [Klebsiella pneumoniae]
RWQVEILSANEGEHGGFKEVIAKISGDGVYGRRLAAPVRSRRHE